MFRANRLFGLVAMSERKRARLDLRTQATRLISKVLQAIATDTLSVREKKKTKKKKSSNLVQVR
jgi:hypothetical protein